MKAVPIDGKDYRLPNGLNRFQQELYVHLINWKWRNITKDKHSCYYHDVRKFKYWTITEAYQSFFANHAAHTSCPFRGGMNQLWRNQLLALGIEQDERQPYKQDKDLG